MSLPAQTSFEPGRVYRTRELCRFSANPTRLAKRLVSEGRLKQAAQGMFYQAKRSRFGDTPASSTEILRAFFDGSPFLISGPPKWNALGLGATSMFAATLVYNTKRSGEFEFDGRRYLLRRVLFPEDPPPEYFVIDLLQHHEMAGVSLDELEQGLRTTLANGKWNVDTLREMAERYGTKSTLALMERAIQATQ